DYMRLGTMQYSETLTLADKEVVLTFDDGPLPPHSNKILDILTSECVKATFFISGRMARQLLDVVRREYAAGYTIGAHSQNHPMTCAFGTGSGIGGYFLVVSRDFSAVQWTLAPRRSKTHTVRGFLTTNGPASAGVVPATAVVVLRHTAFLLALDHTMWQKYKIGQSLSILDPETKAPAVKNPFLQPKTGVLTVDEMAIDRGV